MPTSHNWSPITGLDDPNALTDRELEPLKRVWAAHKRELKAGGALEQFEKRLRREWAIETGIIEKVYSLDRGITRTLIEKGIDAALIPHGTSEPEGTVVARIIQDHYDALEGMLDFVGGQRQLSTSYVRELHAALLHNQQTYAVVDQFGNAFERPLEKGQYKTASNSPTRPDGSVHEYCPPEHVAAEMDQLIALHADYQARALPPEVHAAWLHHRFAQIHPFADGNGRVARALASLVFIKADWFPLIVKRDDWTRYIEALEKADRGDLRPLVALFVEAQRNTLIQATEASYEARPIASPEEAITAVRDRLLQRGKLPLREWLKAKETATLLSQFAGQRFGQIMQQLNQEISSLGKNFSFGLAGPQQAAIDQVLLKVAQRAGYLADFGEYNVLVQLFFNSPEGQDWLGLSFHAVGPRYRGIIGVLGYLAVRGEPVTLEGGSFQINYEEGVNSAQARFSAWLDRMIVEGLDAWRRSM